MDKKKIPLLGTIHSICFKKFCSDKKVISEKQKKEFFELNRMDYEFTKAAGDELVVGDFNMKTHGNLIISFYDMLRSNLCKDISDFKNESELKKAFIGLKEHPMDFSSIFVSTFGPYKILVEYEKFKSARNLIDYADMLLIAYKNKYTIPEASILFCDEYQDISPIQEKLLSLWAKDKKEVYIVGDPNQTIYQWSGASADFLLDEIKKLDKKKGDELILLPKTYRMSSVINKHCHEYVLNNIRRDKQIVHEVKPNKEGGEVIKEDLGGDLSRVLEFIRPNIPTFILLRTNYYKKVLIEEILIPNGILFKEIRGQSLWNAHTISLFNGIVNLIEKKPLDPFQADALFDAVPFKLGLLKRGAKSDFKNKDKKEEYNFQDLLDAGFNELLSKFLSYEKIFDMLDLTDRIKLAFESMEKKLIDPVIHLEVGTIHASKGLGRTDVIVFADVSKKIVHEMAKSQDNFESEIRVFYVGQSRARERLVILRGGFKHSDRYVIP